MKEKDMRSVRIGELLNQLTILTYMDINEIVVKLDFIPNFIYGIHEKEDILHKNILEKLSLSVAINDKVLNYTVISDLDEPMSNGQTLYDQAKIVQKYSLKEKDVNWDRTYIEIPEESLDDINVSIDLNDIETSDFYSKAFFNAVINAANAESKKAKCKTLIRR